MNTLQVSRVSNGFLVVPQMSGDDPAVFITLTDLLTFIAGYLGDLDTDFNMFEQQIQIVEKVHTA